MSNSEAVFPFDGRDTDLAGMRRRGLMLVLSSPSGAGKTTIARRILESDDRIGLSVSVTTRQPRPGEQDGVDYHFRSISQFEKMVDDGEMLEHAIVFENRYGTPRQEVEKRLEQGHDVLFDIDWQGTQQLAAKAREDLVSVFVLPPSMAELERRLRGRGQDSEDVIASRMAKNYDEMCHWAEYDYIVVNHDLEDAVTRVESILAAERHKRTRLYGVDAFVRSMKPAD